MANVLVRISKKKLRNQEHLMYHKQTSGKVSASEIGSLRGLLDAYKELIETEDLVLTTARKSDDTRVLKDLDNERVDIVRSLGSRLRAITAYKVDSAEYDAAMRATIIYDVYKPSFSKGYMEKTGAIHNLLNDFYVPEPDLNENLSEELYDERYKQDIVTLRLGPVLDALKRANDNFISQHDLRATNKASKSHLDKVKDIRLKVDEMHSRLLNVLEGMIASVDIPGSSVGDDTDFMDHYRQLVAELNTLSAEYANSTKIRLNKDRNKETKPSENGASEGEGEGTSTTTPSDDQGGFGDENTPSANA